MNFYFLVSALFLIAALALLLPSAAQTGDGTGPEPPKVPGGLLSGNDTVGPVGNVGIQSKFDDGFYEKISGLLQDDAQGRRSDTPSEERYYSTIIVVSRDDGDGRNADDVSRENRDAVVNRLNLLGARDIVAAELLSFVTASIPVNEIPGFSLHGEVYGMGDGELPVTLAVDTARVTIHATADEIRASDGTILNGSGVVAGVLDTGINHPVALNGKVIGRVSCDKDGCVTSTTMDVTGSDNPVNETTSHGTQVAQVLAASGLPMHNGIAPGVELLDVNGPGGQRSVYSTLIMTHGLDWALRNGADVVNLSFSINSCSTSKTTTNDLILNEAVDKGMVAVVHRRI